MSLLAMIAERSILAFGLLVFATQIAAYELGYWIGRKDRSPAGNSPETVGTVVGGMLGLLAFVLALTLSFASTRLDDRRMGSLKEANAIGTAWLRAKTIEGPHAEQITSLLRQYTEVRRDFVERDRNDAAMERLNERTGMLQTAIWDHLTAIVRERPDAASVSLMTALNEAFDAGAAERFAFDLGIPPQLVWLLLGMALLCMASLGYQFSLRKKPVRVLVGMLTLMWTAVMVNILDLGSTRIGYFRTGTAVYDWTLESFERSGPQPPR